MNNVRAVPPALSLCPNCDGADLRRSHVRIYERPWKWFTASRPYRCSGCRSRFWGRLRPDEARLLAARAGGRHEPADPIETPALDLAEIDRVLDRDRVTAI